MFFEDILIICSELKNVILKGKEPWLATVHRVAKSQTQLRDGTAPTRNVRGLG